MGEAGFLVLMELKTELGGEEILKRAAASGVGVRIVEEDGRPGERRLLLSCASVPSEQYGEALLRLRDCLA